MASTLCTLQHTSGSLTVNDHRTLIGVTTQDSLPSTLFTSWMKRHTGFCHFASVSSTSLSPFSSLDSHNCTKANIALCAPSSPPLSPPRKRKSLDPESPWYESVSSQRHTPIASPPKRRKIVHAVFTSVLSPRPASQAHTRSTSTSIEQALKLQLISRLRQRYGDHLKGAAEAATRFRKRVLLNAVNVQKSAVQSLPSPPEDEIPEPPNMAPQIEPDNFLQLSCRQTRSSTRIAQNARECADSLTAITTHDTSPSEVIPTTHLSPWKDGTTFPRRGSLDDLRKHREEKLQDCDQDQINALLETLPKSRNQLNLAFLMQMQIQQARIAKQKAAASGPPLSPSYDPSKVHPSPPPSPPEEDVVAAANAAAVVNKAKDKSTANGTATATATATAPTTTKRPRLKRQRRTLTA